MSYHGVRAEPDRSVVFAGGLTGKGAKPEYDG
jgi:hypothetical protein